MFLEKLWPHLPTPIVNLLVLVEAAIIYWYINDSVVVSLTFIGMLTVAFILGSIKSSQPFHIERVAVLITLAFINVAFLAQHTHEVTEILHLHTERALFVARIVYALVWVVLLIMAILGYFYNAGRPISNAWPLLVIVMLIAILIPIEPDSFVMNQSLALWIARVLIALTLFTLVTVGDTTNITIQLYHQHLSSGHHSARRATPLTAPAAEDVDLPIARTLIWLPITLWVMFVPKALVLVALLLIVLVGRSVIERWHRVSHAHKQYMLSAGMLQKALHFAGIDRLIVAIDDIENQALDAVRSHIDNENEKRRQQESKKHRRKHSRDDKDSESNMEQLVLELGDNIASQQQQRESNVKYRSGKSQQTVNRW